MFTEFKTRTLLCTKLQTPSITRWSFHALPPFEPCTPCRNSSSSWCMSRQFRSHCSTPKEFTVRILALFNALFPHRTRLLISFEMTCAWYDVWDGTTAPSIPKPYVRLECPGPNRCAGIISALRSRGFLASQVMHAATRSLQSEKQQGSKRVLSTSGTTCLLRRVYPEPKGKPRLNRK